MCLDVRNNSDYEPEWSAPQSPLFQAEIAEFFAQFNDVADPAAAIAITVTPIVIAAVPFAIAAATPSVSANSNQQTSVGVDVEPETAVQTAPTCPVCKQDLLERVAKGAKLVTTEKCGHLMCENCLIKSPNMEVVDPWGITIRFNQG